MKAIFNSSPLIFLSKLGVLEESLTFFDEAYIPLEVKQGLAYGILNEGTFKPKLMR